MREVKTHGWWRRLMLVVAGTAVLVAATSCSGSDDDEAEADAAVDTTEPADAAATETASSTTSTTTSLPEGGVAIEGLQLSAVTFGAGGVVTLANTSAADIPLDGMQVCNGANCTPLAGSIAAADQVEVAGADLGGLDAAAGEAMVFSSSDTTDVNSVVSYVAWGTGGPTGVLAVEAGLWPEGATVAATEDGISLGGFPGDPESWG